MNFYDKFNATLTYIEQHLDSEIDPRALAQISGLNYAILQKVFPFLTGITLAEYVRNRRLTLAGKDLVQTDLRIIDIALKYGYESPEAFSRAFQKFHHLKPSTVKKHTGRLQHFSKIQLTAPDSPRTMTYEVVETLPLTLHGLEVLSDNEHIKFDAPRLFQYISQCFPELPHPDYGVLDYELGRDDDRRYHYYALWENLQRPHFLTKHIAGGRWLKFQIPSQTAPDIQAVTEQFYSEFLPTCEYQLRPEPELEHYHDQVTDLLVPIY